MQSEIISLFVLSLLLFICRSDLINTDFTSSCPTSLPQLIASNSELILTPVSLLYKSQMRVALVHENNWCSTDSIKLQTSQAGVSVNRKRNLRSFEKMSLYITFSLADLRVGFFIFHKFLNSPSHEAPGGASRHVYKFYPILLLDWAL